MSFYPTDGSVLGLWAWYKASAIVGASNGSTVASWPDISRNGQLGYNMNVPSGCSAPTFAFPSYVNGYPAVRFTQNILLDSGFGMDTPCTIYIVKGMSAVNTTPGSGPLLYSECPGGSFTISASIGNPAQESVWVGPTNNPTDIATPGPDPSVSIVSIIVNGANSAIYVNGVVCAVGTLASFVGGACALGAAYSGPYPQDTFAFFQGDVAEILVYTGLTTGAHDSTTRQAIEGYLGQYYGITLPASPANTPTFASGFTDTTGLFLTVDINAPHPPLLPSGVNIPGFVVWVNGISREVSTAVVSGSSAVEITLLSPVRPGDVVTLSYAAGSPALTDSYPATVAAFNHQPIMNNTVLQRGALFDPISWLTSGPAAGGAPVGNLFERRLGYAVAGVIVDTIPPYGDAILNEDPGTGGLQVHHFNVLGSSASILAGPMVVQDPLNNTMRVAAVLGDASNTGEYETIGTGGSRCLAQFFAADSTGAYPSVTAIEVGILASRAKDYRIEVITAPGGVWQPIVYMIGNTETLDWFRYTFTAAVKLAGVRISYRGDYYCALSSGNVTLSADDTLTDVAAVQVSHYPDFRDATDFPLSDATGWAPFSAGTSVFDWDFINSARVWSALPGYSANNLIGVVGFGAIWAAWSATQLFTLDPVNGLVKSFDVSQNAMTLGASITCVAEYQSALYAGLSNGTILCSTSGATWSVLSAGVAPAIGALASFAGLLWVGTSAAATDATGAAQVWMYDGTRLSQIRTIAQADSTSLAVSALAPANGFLYVGVSGAVGQQAASVYQTDGTAWTLTLSTEADRIDAIRYAPLDSSLWVAASNGNTWTLSFNASGAPQSWAQNYQSDSTDYYDIVSDPEGAYLFFPSDKRVAVAMEESGNLAFSAVPWIPTFEGGLLATYWNTSTPNIINTSATPAAVVSISTPEEWANLLTNPPASVNTVSFNMQLTGYILPLETAEYTFYGQADNGLNIVIGDTVVIDNWTGELYTMQPSAPISLTAQEWTPITIQYYQSGGGGAMIVLQWSTANMAQQTVPDACFQPSFGAHVPFVPSGVVADMAYSDVAGGAVLAVSGHQAYELDTSFLSTTTRDVYVRYRDSAGNATPLPGLSDEIIQDQEQNSEGVKVSDGTIYQVNSAQSVVATFESNVSATLYAPDRVLEETGEWDAEPYYVPTLSRWDMLSLVATLPAGVAPTAAGLEQGVEIDVYIRSADTREECLAADWGTPFVVGNISAPAITGLLSGVSGEFDLSTVVGQWLQYRLVLVSASRGYAPVVQSVTLSYQAANASYFFTSILDTGNSSVLDTDGVHEGPPYPQFRRLLLTADHVPNGGSIVYGYTQETDPGSTYDFSRYTQIIPNAWFDIPTPAENIRFGILLMSASSLSPAIVDDFGVMLEAGSSRLKLIN